MALPIEKLVTEAQARLEEAGAIDMEAWVRRYPEHAGELRPLLQTMLQLHKEKQWIAAEERSRAFASDLFLEVFPSTSGASADATVGHLFRRVSEEGLATRLPREAVEKLSLDTTPVEQLDNPTLKQIATRIAIRFDELLKEVKRLRGLERLWSSGTAPVMTRHKEQSSTEEHQALIEKVKRHSRKGSKEKE